MDDFLVLRNDLLNLRVSRRGGSVVDGHTVDGRPFLRPYIGAPAAFTVRQAACFPLLPVGNRVAGNAFMFEGKRHEFEPNTDEPLHIHGDGWLADWDIAEASRDTIRLTFAKQQAVGSPHRYRAEQSIRLVADTVEFDLVVENIGDAKLPFGLGFHPFFPRTPKLLLRAPAHAYWTEGGDQLPLSREPVPSDLDFNVERTLPPRWLNNCFEGWDGSGRIVWPEAGVGVTIEAGTFLSRYMLYAPTDERYFCLEPMSHTPNALASVDTDPMGLRMLGAGEKLRGGFAMTVFDWSADHV